MNCCCALYGDIWAARQFTRVFYMVVCPSDITLDPALTKKKRKISIFKEEKSPRDRYFSDTCIFPITYPLIHGLRIFTNKLSFVTGGGRQQRV